MRLYELQRPLHELDTDEQAVQGTRLTHKELDFVHELVKDDIMSQAELSGVVADATVDYTRNNKSLRMIAPRMYTIIHGQLPLDKVDNAGWFDDMPEPLINYMRDRGYDVNALLRKAEIDNEERQKERDAKRTRDDAKIEMNRYWKEHKRYLHRPSVLKARPKIIDALMDGEAADIVFGPYFKAEPELESLHSRIKECQKARTMLSERIESAKQFNEIGDMLNDALFKYNAAKRGLGISNRITDPGQRAMHRSRIMGNLNRLRALVRKIEQML